MPQLHVAEPLLLLLLAFCAAGALASCNIICLGLHQEATALSLVTLYAVLSNARVSR